MEKYSVKSLNSLGIKIIKLNFATSVQDIHVMQTVGNYDTCLKYRILN